MDQNQDDASSFQSKQSPADAKSIPSQHKQSDGSSGSFSAERRRFRLTMLCLVGLHLILCLIWAAQNYQDDLAMMLGAWTGRAAELVLVFLLYFPLRRYATGRVALIALMMFLIGFLVSPVLSRDNSHKQPETRNQLANLGTLFSSDNADDDLRRVQVIAVAYQKKLADVIHDVQLDIASANLDVVLEPSTLANDAKVELYRERLRMLQRSLQLSESRWESITSGIRPELEAAIKNKNFRDGFFNSFDHSHARSIKNSARYFSVQRSVLVETAGLLDEVTMVRRKVDPSTGILLFETTEDVNRYNARIKKIQELAAEEEHLSKSMKNRLRATQDFYKQFLKNTEPDRSGDP